MTITDMDMLQDYEKDTRMATIAYSFILTDIINPELRQLFSDMALRTAESQNIFTDMILKKGNRP